MAESDSPLRSWQVFPARKFKSCPPRHAILAFEIIKLTFVGFSADAGTAAVGVFFVNCGRMFADCALERVDASGLSFIYRSVAQLVEGGGL